MTRAPQRPIKLLIASQYAEINKGGAERYIHEIRNCLVSSGHFRVSTLSADAKSSYRLPKPLISLFSSTLNPIWLPLILKRLRTDRPDLIYLHYSVPGIVDCCYLSARRLNIPYVVMYHSDISGIGTLKKIVGTVYYHLIGKQILRNAVRVFVNSEAFVSGSSFLKKDSHIRPLAAPPGVDPPIYNGTPSHPFRFLLFVGKPALTVKGFSILEKAWQQLRKSYPDLALVVIGTPPHHRIRNPHPDIRLLPVITDRCELADWYASASVTILPSLITESFGMVLAEALAAGCPVVGSRIGGIPAIITDGENGYLVRPGSVGSLATAIQNVLENENQFRQRIAAFNHAFPLWFSWERTTAIVSASLIDAFDHHQKA
ncbi:MAG: hypothetical protein CSA22_03955 [Deltaproteobacteria bacterium]|nr:MAG: hypothetical protein CSA22_03955 [Deltaproteobacteria bacterium]